MRADSPQPPRIARLLLGIGVAAAALLALPAASGATVAGLNGRIAFEKSEQTGEFEFQSGVWSMNPDGSGTTKLSGAESASDGAYSADGAILAFVRLGRIVVATTEGSGEHVVANSTSHRESATTWRQNFHPPAHPSQTLAWAKVNESREVVDEKYDPNFAPNDNLALVHYTGTFVSREYCPVSGDGATTCSSGSEFENECIDCGSSIEAIDPTTGALRGVLAARETGVSKSDPSFSVTGALAYKQESEAEEDVEKIVVVSASGAAPVAVAVGVEADEPDFSPDGSRIIFRSGRHQFSIVPTAGGAAAAINVPPPPGDEFWAASSPIWSPDGTLIAFADLGSPPDSPALGRYTDGGVFLMHPDGSGVAQIKGELAEPTSWQPILRPPAPPAVRARAVKGKKKLKLSRKGVAVVGKVVCGSSPCALKASGAKLKLGRKKYAVKATLAKTLTPGASGQVKVKVGGKALTALKAKHAGKLALSVAVTDAAGAEKLAFTPKLLAPAAKAGKAKHQPSP